jgi:DNA-binding transcriptional LysR family regulator
MTASGLGASIVPGELVARSGFPKLVVRRIERPSVIRNISVVTKRNRTLSDAAKLFIQHMHASMAPSRAPAGRSR